MAKLKDEAQSYQAGPSNIAELEKVPVDIDVEDEEFTYMDEEGKEQTGKNKVTTINGTKYRIPKSVIKQLKAVLEEKPDMKTFKVKKTGAGLNTDYTVIPLE